MSELLCKNQSIFSGRKVSIDQAIKLLYRNGIKVNREKAEIILDFLYLIARTYKMQKEHDSFTGSEHPKA